MTTAENIEKHIWLGKDWPYEVDAPDSERAVSNDVKHSRAPLCCSHYFSLWLQDIVKGYIKARLYNVIIWYYMYSDGQILRTSFGKKIWKSSQRGCSKYGFQKKKLEHTQNLYLEHFQAILRTSQWGTNGNPQITRDLPIAAKTAWDIVPEEKVYNAAAVRGESVLSMVFTKVFVCI